MAKVKIALIGCGGVSQMHLDGFRLRPERVQLVAACDPDENNLRRRQQEYGFPEAFGTVEEMIQRADWDVAVVCTPTHLRAPVVNALASAGKHILVEKPFADTFEAAKRMVDTCSRAGVRLAVDQNFRYHYPFHVARDILRKGELGQVVSLFHQDLMFRQDTGWRIQQPRHALSVMGVHWLDGVRWMLGCEALTIACEIRSSPAIECVGETEASIQVTFVGGTVATYVQSFSSPVAWTETIVIGETSVLVLDYTGCLHYSSERRESPPERYSSPYAGSRKPESSLQCLDDLLMAIEEGREAPNSGEDNLRTMALLEGAYRSAALHQVVSLRGGLLE